MQKSLLLISMLSIGLVIGFLFGAFLQPGPTCPRTVASFKLNEPERTKWMSTVVRRIECPNGDGTVQSYVVAGESRAARTVTLIGHTPVTLLDHHSRQEFTLIDVNGMGATVAYLEMFDHRSFGPNVITVDCGVVALEVTAKSGG